MIERMRQLARRTAAFLGRADRESIMNEEMRFHLDMEAKALERAGMSPEEARRHARVLFGGVERHKEDGRDARGTRLAEDLVQDLTYAARQLRTSPGFAAATLSTLALGIGLSTVMFGILNVAMFEPLPFESLDRLVAIRQYSPATCPNCSHIAAANYYDVHDRTRTLSSVSMYAEWSPVLRGADRSDVLRGARVTHEFFETLRVRPLLGRLFTPADVSADQASAVVVSERLWRARFAGDSTIVGRTLVLDSRPMTIVGVLPADVSFPTWSEIWLPIIADGRLREERKWTNYQVIGRLRDGATLASANAELATISASLAKAYPNVIGTDVIGVGPLSGDDGGKDELVLFGIAVALIVVIACINLAGLLIARLSAREREISVRTAMGAAPGRIARQLLCETLLLALIGSLLGAVVAAVGMGLIKAASPASLVDAIPAWPHLGVDWRALAFATAMGALTGILIGLWPAVKFSRPQVARMLRVATPTMTGSGRTRRILVGMQIAFAVVLMSAAGMIGRSLAKAYAAPRGFDGTNVVSFKVQLPPAAAGSTPDPYLFDRIVERVEAIPGVDRAAATIALPLSFSYSSNTFRVEGQPVAAGARPSARMQPATPDYFAVLGIPIVQGRAFTSSDRAGSPPVAIVNEAFVRKFIPDGRALGRMIFIDDKPWQIVGVSRNIFYMRTNERLEPEVIRPMTQWPSRWGHIAVRTRGNPLALIPVLSKTIREVAPDMGTSRIATMDQLLSNALAADRLMLGMMGGFAAAAFLISVIGLYGLMSYTVGRQTREFGVRVALGADRRGLLRLVLGRGLRLAAVGGALGVIGALGVGRLLTGRFYGVTPTDPLVYGALVVSVVLLAVIASYLPARRAASVDPLTSLRAE